MAKALAFVEKFPTPTYTESSLSSPPVLSVDSISILHFLPQKMEKANGGRGEKKN